MEILNILVPDRNSINPHRITTTKQQQKKSRMLRDSVMMSLEDMWRVIAMVAVFGIYVSLTSLCLSSSSSWYAPMGATTLYVVLMLMSCTNFRIYKEEEPPLPATRAGFSVILMISMFYFPYYYSIIDAFIYVCSLFAFGISIFQLSAQLSHGHKTRLLHLFLWFNLSLQWLWARLRMLIWVITHGFTQTH
ncbi:unnamed protein product [Eruca vesicaria subsp. sativa]|uniref:Uncharacterized protein n=1 Tax=Eruca vesicaria subsp. sativa TaxID=29727 RepID=A0ABC8K6Z9_ERUVS|nr:unnamed protein product [Eruca vesicaria subsp. sativa]